MNVFKFKYHVGLGHTQVKVFAGPNWDNMKNTGTLIMLKEEWEDFLEMLDNSNSLQYDYEEEK